MTGMTQGLKESRKLGAEFKVHEGKYNPLYGSLICLVHSGWKPFFKQQKPTPYIQ